MTTIRQRFPNFICDGMPYGPDEERYRHTFETLDEFFEIDWVQHWIERGFTEWCVVGGDDIDNREMLFAVDTEEPEPMWFVTGWIVDGQLDLPTYDNFNEFCIDKTGRGADEE